MNTNYITYLQSMDRSAHTITNYTKYIQNALDYIQKPEEDITYMDLIEWRGTLKHLKPNSRNLQIAAIKNYFAVLYKMGAINNDPAQKLEKVRVRESDVKQKPYLDPQQIRDMVNYANTLRDKAIVLLYATTGLRVSELTGLTIDQYNNMDGQDNREIEIIGKGKRHRRIYIVDETKEAIDAYLRSRPNSEYSNLFLSNYGGPIHSNNLSQTLKNIAHKAGIENWEDVSNHALRAAFATMKNEQGVDLVTIQAAMGHSSLDTTLIYIKNSQKHINNAIKQMAF